MFNSPLGKRKKKERWALSIFKTSEYPGPDCESFKNRNRNRRTGKASSVWALQHHQWGQARVWAAALSLSSLTNLELKRPLPPLAVAGLKVTPLQGWSQELGLGAGGSSPLCCMNQFLLIPYPTNPQGHTRVHHPSFLRRPSQTHSQPPEAGGWGCSLRPVP